jgi:hypothetical protein
MIQPCDDAVISADAELGVIDRSSPEAAHARLDTHLAVCIVWQGGVTKQLDMLTKLAWTAVGSTIGLLAVGLATLLVLLITRPHL